MPGNLTTQDGAPIVDELTLNRTGYRDILKISHDPACSTECWPEGA
jgi:hypothetical protein